MGKKVAVLAIDPSSGKSRGSILGDKTRMESLSQDPNAFIRPSASAGSLGGVAQKTRESILLCEAAGYDVIIVETVGVGQSETAVKSMVDFFILLMLAGAGDELQGIKRGIMEMADLLLINKDDGGNSKAVKAAKGEYKRALHLFPPNENGWIARVESCSAIEAKGMESVWKITDEFFRSQISNGFLEKTRTVQALQWFRESLGELLTQAFHENEEAAQRIDYFEAMIKDQKIEPFFAAQNLIEEFLNL